MNIMALVESSGTTEFSALGTISITGLRHLWPVLSTRGLKMAQQKKIAGLAGSPNV
jgi:hypothetical protein